MLNIKVKKFKYAVTFITPKGSKIEAWNNGDEVKNMDHVIEVLEHELKWLKDWKAKEEGSA